MFIKYKEVTYILHAQKKYGRKQHTKTLTLYFPKQICTTYRILKVHVENTMVSKKSNSGTNKTMLQPIHTYKGLYMHRISRKPCKKPETVAASGNGCGKMQRKGGGRLTFHSLALCTF